MRPIRRILTCASGQYGMPSRVIRPNQKDGDGNAEDEDKVELQKAVQDDGLWQSKNIPSGQTARDDQAFKQVPA